MNKPVWHLATSGGPPLSAAQLRKRADALLTGGDRRGAAQAYLRYMSAPIADPVLRMAVADLKRGAWKDAELRVRGYLKTSPNDPIAMRMLGQIGVGLNSNPQAEIVFRRAIALVPASMTLHFDLATTLFLQGKFDEALAETALLLQADASNAAYRELKAAILGKLGELAGAADLYRALLDERPDNSRVWVLYGNTLRFMRRSAEALAAFRRATELAPGYGEAWWNIANMKTGALTSDDRSAIRTALASSTVKPFDRFHLRFALARSLEDSGEFEASFAAYRAANSERLAALPRPEPSNATDAVRRMIAVLTPEFLAERHGAGNPSTDPIFILGMPRSGSTLLEQILSAHPAIEGTQELADILLIAGRLKRATGPGPAAYTDALAKLGTAELSELGTEYLTRARTKRKTDWPHFLDKQPANWSHVGLIHLILPNARIIDMRRDPLECCLSMFRQHFARGAIFTYSVEGLAAEYAAYLALTAHLDIVAPGRIKRVQLADLQADLEGVVRDVLDYLGLPFAPECLRFFESDRAVFTPSSEQVRRPINDDSTAVFRNFEPYLDDLRLALATADAKFRLPA